MGRCDYCGERPAGHEIVDGDESSSMAMLCDVCFARVGGVILDMTDDNCLKTVATIIAEADSGYRGMVEKNHIETAKSIIHFLKQNGRN